MAWVSGRWSRRVFGTASAAALLVAGVAPAAAQGPHHEGRPPMGHPHGGGWYGDRWYDDGLDVGDVIGIAALIGAVAVIANSASKDRAANSGYDPNYDQTPAPNYDTQGNYDARDNGAYAPQSSDARNPTARIVSSDDAVNACVDAARSEAEMENHGYAQIVDVDPAQPYGASGGWSVNGRVEQRSSYQNRDGVVRRFSCEVEDGRVAHVYLSKDSVR